MTQGPWRCSQCGTINEPVANSCRTCGTWPSLFDLEDSTLDESELEELRASDPDLVTFEPVTVEVPAYEPPPPVASRPLSEPLAPAPEVYDDAEAEQPSRRRWTSAIIPVAILLYFIISAIVER